MNERKQKVEAIFLAALELTSPDLRETYLSEACAGDPDLRREVDDLLHAAASGEDVFQAHERAAASSRSRLASTALEQAGTRIGRYKLLEQIGEGGFGVVFMAEQEAPVRRRVALKIIKFGMDTRQVVARFEAERQALALMDHPNIAKVLDAGATDTGRPYFVMELVHGIPITQFCDRNKLSTPERLKMFIAVCQAIQHAHQKGVIHRDIKPPNILVTLDHGEPMPKVIDFGIAKAIHQRLTEKTLFTNFAQMIGTPAYMSPEQAAMSNVDIDSRTDVYSLGVLLYELLTGTTPIHDQRLREAGYEEMARLIREDEPERPSTRLSTMRAGELSIVTGNRGSGALVLAKLFRNDLDWIAMKALEKDRRRRYDTPSQLVADLQRHQRNEPVLATPPGVSYKLQKFIRRNKAGVSVAGAFILAIMLTLVFGTISYKRERQARLGESAARQRAEIETKRAQMEAARATAKEMEALRSEYAADMPLAQRFISEGNRGRGVAMLEKYLPSTNSNAASPDLRGWEWHYLAGVTHGQEIAVLKEHATQVNDVQYSPDGRWLASCGLDASLLVWDTGTWQLAQKLKAPGNSSPNEVYSVTFSPDGKLLAAGSDLSRRIGFWEVSTWKLSFVLTNLHRVTALAFSRDGRSLAAAGHLGKNGLAVWDLESRSMIAHWRLPEISDLPFALTFSADGKQLYYDLEAGQLGRWSRETGQALESLRLHDKYSIQRLLIGESGSIAVTCSANGVLRAWELPGWRQKYEITNECALAISEWQDLLVTTGNQEVRQRRLASGEPLGPGMIGHLETLSAGAISPSNNVIATASFDKTVRLWPKTPPALSRLFVKLPTNEIASSWNHRPRLTADGLDLFAIQAPGGATVSVWQASGLTMKGRYPLPRPDFEALDIAPGGAVAAVGGLGGELLLVNLATGATNAQTTLSSNRITFLRFSPDGQQLVAGHTKNLNPAFDWYLDILDGRSLKHLKSLPSTGGDIKAIAFSAGNRYLALAYYNALGTEVVDLETGRALSRYGGHVGRVISISMTPDARLVASAGTDGPIHLWDGRTGKLISKFSGTWEVYQALCLSPDGSRLAGGYSGVDIWDLVTRRPVLTLNTTNEIILSMAWSSDMRQLSATSFDTLRLWPADSFTPSLP